MKKFIILSIALLVFCAGAMAQPVRAKIADSSFIFNNNRQFAACHASTIVLLPGGRLMAAWFGGSAEGSPDVCIWTSVKGPAGWSVPQKAASGAGADGQQQACWNPVLFLAKNKKLYLFYKVGLNPREWRGLYKWSADYGQTWSTAVDLPSGFLGPIKDKPVQLATGDILCPSSVESTDEKHWTIHIEQADASLRHWKMIPIDCDTFQTIQPTILRYPGGRLQLLARSKQNVLVQSWSADEGRTWSRVKATSLPNPNSGVDAVTVGRLQVLVYNPMKAGKQWWLGRSVLKVAVSADGADWHDVATLEDAASGEFSYPAVISGQHNDVYITYTYKRRRIRFVHLMLIK